jgi:ribosomal silencing factor RsfS
MNTRLIQAYNKVNRVDVPKPRHLTVFREDTIYKSKAQLSKAIKDKPWHVEGSDNAEWVLMDYVNIVVHVFQKHIREYYNIESLWGDAKITTIENKY